jgi:hypothetical protein
VSFCFDATRLIFSRKVSSLLKEDSFSSQVRQCLFPRKIASLLDEGGLTFMKGVPYFYGRTTALL